MGAGASSGSAGGGYRVLSVQPGSPSSDVLFFPTPESALEGVREPTRGSLVAFFDIIVAVNGVFLDHEGDAFANEIRGSLGKAVLLSVYNTKAQKERPVQVFPRSDWGGEGLLGMHVKWDPIETPQDSALHVTEVAPDSPAARAGLIADEDFIIGFPGGTFENADTFGDYLSGNDGSSATLFVLRAATDSIRAITLDLSQAGGGVGLTVAQGHLHAMPNAGTPGINEWAVAAQSPVQPAGQQAVREAPAEAATLPAPLMAPALPTQPPPVYTPGDASAVAAAAFSVPPVHMASVFAPPQTAGISTDASPPLPTEQAFPPSHVLQPQQAARSHHLLQPASHTVPFQHPLPQQQQQQQPVQEFPPVRAPVTGGFVPGGDAGAYPPSVSVELPASAAPARSAGWFR